MKNLYFFLILDIPGNLWTFLTISQTFLREFFSRDTLRNCSKDNFLNTGIHHALFFEDVYLFLTDPGESNSAFNTSG